MLAQSTRYALTAVCLAWSALASAEATFVLGPIEANKPGAVSVLGHRFAVTPATVCAVNGAVVPHQACADELIDSTYVAVESDAASPGVAKRLLILEERYVPGASPIKVIGRVTSTRSSLGTVSIGSLILDLNTINADAVTGSGIAGQLLEVSGTQPVPGGVILTQSGKRVSAPSTQIIVGTGRATLVDSNIIVGTGKAGAASSPDIIVGTGRAATPATNIIVGTGKAAALTTDIIVGTGRASTPTKNIIVGTGRSASTNIIVGTGRQ